MQLVVVVERMQNILTLHLVQVLTPEMPQKKY
jgi:hypothetical protein